MRETRAQWHSATGRVHYWVATAKRSPGKSLLILASVSAFVWLAGLLAVHVLYRGLIPGLADVIFRSRFLQPIDTYFLATRTVRLGAAAVPLVAAIIIHFDRDAPVIFRPQTLLRKNGALQLGLLVVAYCLAWGPLLLSANGVWWDDWVLEVSSPPDMIALFSATGFVEVGYVHIVMHALGPAGYSIASFVIHLGSALGMRTILNRIPGITPLQSTFGAAVFAVSPLFAARNAAINFSYTVALGALIGAWVLLSQRRELTWIGWLLLSAASFAAAAVPSTALFLMIPLMHHRILRHLQRRSAPLSFASQIPTLVVIAAGLNSLHAHLFRRPRTGGYVEYYAVSGGDLFFGLTGIGISVLMLAAILFTLRSAETERSRLLLFGVALAIAGVCLALLGLLPYIALGSYPPYFQWQTRYEVLLPIGLSLMAVGTARAGRVFASWSVVAAFAALLLISLGWSSSRISFAYWDDHRQQVQIIEALRNRPDLARADVYFFLNQTESNNIFGRPLDIYEWNGIMERVWGGQHRLTIRSVDHLSEIESLYGGAYGPNSHGGAKRFNPDNARLLAVIEVSRSKAQHAPIVLREEFVSLK